MKHKAWYKVASGTFLVLLWVAATSFTIYTDKSMIMGGHGENVQLSWEVLQMPWLLVTGAYQGIELVATLSALMIFASYVVLSILVQFKNNKGLYSLVMVIIAVDGIANFQFFYGFKQIPLVYQCMATGLVFITLVYFGPKGLELLFEGLSDLGFGKGGTGRDEDFN